MQDKVSVYNNPMGGPQQPPPPPRPSPMLFKRDGYLNSSFIPPGTKLEDAIRVNIHQKQHNDVLAKYIKMLLSSISIKWPSYASAPRAPKEPIQRKERVRKEFKIDFGRKIEDASDKVLISIGKAFKPVVYPPYKLAMTGLDLLGKAIVKGDELIEKGVQKGVVEPLLLLHAKIAPPVEKAASYISETLIITVEWLERELERIIEFMLPPIQEALETVQVTLAKLYTPFKKGRNWLAKKMPSIPKPSFPSETIDRIFIKPFKVFINTFIAVPLARGIQKAVAPIKKGSQFLSKKGGMAYIVLSNFCRAVGAKIGKRLESLFRKLGRFLVWLFRLLLAFSYWIGRLLLKVPKLLSRLAKRSYRAIGRLTLWAASRFTRN